MEVSKHNKSEEVLRESETNGEKVVSDNEETVIEEVIEPEVLDKTSENHDTTLEEDDEKLDESSSIADKKELEENESEVTSEKKNAKRKIDDVLKEVQNEPNNMDEAVDTPKEIIEDENPAKKVKKGNFSHVWNYLYLA